MPSETFPRTVPSACPHDCPSTCALEVEVLAPDRIGRVRGASDNPYTAGVICAKVARYAERLHHPDRLAKPLRRVGAKGEGRFEEISFEAALDITAEALLKAESRHGPEAVWPYYYAGTMGLVQRDSIFRFRHEKRYSRQYDTVCSMAAQTGYAAGTGRVAGPDPREMAKSDCVVIWGTNPVATQVNVMTHAITARKTRGAKIAVVDIYRTETAKQADLALVIRPGTDAALACAVMHILFRDGHADRDYLSRYADAPEAFEAHLAGKTPEWAADICGVTVEEIEALAALVGATKKTYFRTGYGFTRGRSGSVSMHAVISIPTVTGAWAYEGGGAFLSNGAIFKLDKSMVMATELLDTSVRNLDQSQIGRVLTGDAEALRGGPPVEALFIQNTNPVCIAPESARVRDGFLREDLFTCVHEQFLTDTAKMADIVLPATMFLEHDDIYQAGGQQHLLFGGKQVEAPGECRSNVEVLAGLAERLGLEHPGFAMTAREHIDWLLQHSGLGTLEELEENRWIDCQPAFERAHFTEGFAHPDGKFHFRPGWDNVHFGPAEGLHGAWDALPEFPDFVPVIETTDDEHPFRLATSPARSFLNTSFTETPSSKKREGRPEVMVHEEDAKGTGIVDGDLVILGNGRGTVRLHARIADAVKPGVLIVESIWPNGAFVDGIGINVLIGADPIAPHGGAPFHDAKVWLKKVVEKAA
ncbi:molybdopterin-containing oxidoreductase family protein [Rhodobium gokarnense]|uniref:Anaerobic selenocysteine-containing dehydrogenase n=1 Tax=Rhodobium gokarnense TaxID=364296 RepID=A0ABT3HFL3_9HYPH|nr:molybdopterin oxidoreductase family protein [Rhodobium gokarnense]MCW2309177.1 anaerobic selenocysteine-containing dehydrogenase [Rhodobium gokarnense]